MAGGVQHVFDWAVSVGQSSEIAYVCTSHSMGSTDRCGEIEPGQPISKLQLSWSLKVNRV